LVEVGIRRWSSGGVDGVSDASTAAETDDALLEKYLESGELTDAEVRGALARGVGAGAIIPVLCTAAGKSIGIGTLLDAIVAFLPSPRQAPPVVAINPRTDQAETLTREPAGPLGARFRQDRVKDVALSPDGRTLLVARNDKTARLWDLPTGKPLGPPLALPGFVFDIRFRPDGRAFLTASWDGTVRSWSVEAGKPLNLIYRQDSGERHETRGKLRIRASLSR